MNIADVLAYLYPLAIPREDYEVHEVGIVNWRLGGVAPTHVALQEIAETVEFKAWFTKKQSAIFDATTGGKINAAVHPLCGTDESIGILRDQMVLWGNALGLEFTADFMRLNKIAIAAITDGAIKKAAITDA